MDASAKGSYLLALRLDRAQAIIVGRMGEIRFPAGWYLYAGSAFGPGGLRARLERHRRRVALPATKDQAGSRGTPGAGKKTHWHVDHLREVAEWGGAWASTSDERLECRWAAALRRLPGAEIIAPGFGASDCRCLAHLVRVPTLPDEGWFARELGAKRVIMDGEELGELLSTLSTGSEERRETAATALGRWGPGALEPLSALLKSEDDADTRWWAARALAEVGGGAAVPPLSGALDDPDPDVRACAALALGRIGRGSAGHALVAKLDDDSAFVAGIAADALSMIGEPAVGALARVMGEGNPHVRLLAVRALSRIKDDSILRPLFGALEDPSYLVRYYAWEALEARGVGMVYLSP